MTGEQIATIKVLYCLVIVQAFIKTLFLLRVYDQIGFLVRVSAFLVKALVPYVVYAFGFNVLFALLFLMTGISLPDEYDNGWGGFVWLSFGLRNGLADFEFDDTKGFLPDSLTGSLRSSDASVDIYGEGRGTMMNLAWVIWFANVACMSVLLMSMLIALVMQSYEQILANAEAHIYRQKAELVVECQKVLSMLGVLDSF